MKLPRDLSGKDLIKALSLLDYQVTRQTGSHIRLTTQRNGQHSIISSSVEYLHSILSLKSEVVSSRKNSDQ